MYFQIISIADIHKYSEKSSFILPDLKKRHTLKFYILSKFVFQAYSDIYTSLNEDESQLNEWGHCDRGEAVRYNRHRVNETGRPAWSHVRSYSVRCNFFHDDSATDIRTGRDRFPYRDNLSLRDIPRHAIFEMSFADYSNVHSGRILNPLYRGSDVERCVSTNHENIWFWLLFERWL